MAESSSTHGEERISLEKAEGSDAPLTSSRGDKVHSSPLGRTVHEQEEAKQSHGEDSECRGVGFGQDEALLSPGFRSAVAMAGWDAETLLMAALLQSPVNSGKARENFTSAQDLSPAINDGLRKRDTRTPSSSGQRPRKARWENCNGHPIGRVPMQSLTLLTDSEHDKTRAATDNGAGPSGAATQENRDHGTGTSNEDNASNDREASSSMPPCLDKLREELSCAVCLDICFEPSTISCGHSFCGTCLRSVLKNCGPRCPKCRQAVRIEASRKQQINTVLWNTIQILFPQECAAKLQDRKQSGDEDNDAARSNERPQRGSLGTRLSRVPWRSYESSSSSDPTRVTENPSTSFLSASELMLGRSRSRERNNTSRYFGPVGISTRQTTRLEEEDAVFQESSNPSVESIITGHRRRGIERVPVTQEEIDEDLAMKLQQAELDAATAGDRVVAALATTRRGYQRVLRQRS